MPGRTLASARPTIRPARTVNPGPVASPSPDRGEPILGRRMAEGRPGLCGLRNVGPVGPVVFQKLADPNPGTEIVGAAALLTSQVGVFDDFESVHEQLVPKTSSVLDPPTDTRQALLPSETALPMSRTEEQ